MPDVPGNRPLRRRVLLDMTDTRPCHVLITHRDGQYQAWCKPCLWHSSWFNARSWAKAAAEQHAGNREG